MAAASGVCVCGWAFRAEQGACGGTSASNREWEQFYELHGRFLSFIAQWHFSLARPCLGAPRPSERMCVCVCVYVCGRDYVKYGFCVCAGKRKLLYTKLVRLSNFKIIVYGCGSPTVSENQGNSS